VPTSDGRTERVFESCSRQVSLPAIRMLVELPRVDSEGAPLLSNNRSSAAVLAIFDTKSRKLIVRCPDQFVALATLM
jgi:hypothetical protein